MGRAAAGAGARARPRRAHALATNCQDLAPAGRARACGPRRARLAGLHLGHHGQPKGALHTQAKCWKYGVAAAVQADDLGDLVATVLPLFHVGGLHQTLPALRAGAAVILHAALDAGAALASSAPGPTLTLQVPATMKALMEHRDWTATDLSSLRAVWAGSSIVPEALVEPSTRAAYPCATCTARPRRALLHRAAAGHALQPRGLVRLARAGVEVRLALPTEAADVAKCCACAQRGRPLLAAQRAWTVKAGSTAATWRAGAGRQLHHRRPRQGPDHFGRGKHPPGRKRECWPSHRLVAECAVIGQPDAQWGEIAVVVVVLRPQPIPGMDNQLSNWEQTLRDFLRTRVARYKQPRRWLALPALPKTALGKVQKQQLAQTLTRRPPEA